MYNHTAPETGRLNRMTGKLRGGRIGTMKRMKSSLKKGGGEFYIKRIPKDDPLIVRFLIEPPEWWEFWEHYNDKQGGFFPDYEGMPEEYIGTDDSGKPKKPSKRYLAVVVDTMENKVVPIVLPTTAAKQLTKYYEKYKTLLDRDYELSRDGDGFDTEYLATPETPTKTNLKRFQAEIPDLEEVLNAAIPGGSADDDDLDDDADDDDDEPITTRRSRPGPKKRRPRPRPRDDDEDDDLDDDGDMDEKPVRTRRRPAASTSGVKKKPLGSGSSTLKKKPLRRR